MSTAKERIKTTDLHPAARDATTGGWRLPELTQGARVHAVHADGKAREAKEYRVDASTGDFFWLAGSPPDVIKVDLVIPVTTRRASAAIWVPAIAVVLAAAVAGLWQFLAEREKALAAQGAASATGTPATSTSLPSLTATVSGTGNIVNNGSNNSVTIQR